MALTDIAAYKQPPGSIFGSQTSAKMQHFRNINLIGVMMNDEYNANNIPDKSKLVWIQQKY